MDKVIHFIKSFLLFTFLIYFNFLFAISLNTNYKIKSGVDRNSVSKLEVSSPTDFFRSKNSGDWTNISSWESSVDGTTWIGATSFPTDQSQGILISSNTEIILNDVVTFTKTKVAGKLIVKDKDFSIAGLLNEGLTVESTGVFQIDGLGKPTSYSKNGVVKTGGIVKVENNSASNFSKNVVNNYLDGTNGLFAFSNSSIVEWNNSFYYPYSIGYTEFFRRMDINSLPIFRINSVPGSNGFGNSLNPIKINAILELTSNVVFRLESSKEKKIIGGVKGLGSIVQLSTSGNLILGDVTEMRTPILDGKLVLDVLTAKLKLDYGALIPAQAEILIVSSAESNSFQLANSDIVINGILDISKMRLTNSFNGKIIIKSGGILKIAHSGGLVGNGSAISSVIPNVIIEDGSYVEYNGSSDQLISASLLYYNLIFSGQGVKTPTSAVATHTNGSVIIKGSPIVDFSSKNLGPTGLNNATLKMEGGKLLLGTGGIQPNFGGDYMLTGGVIEFTGSSDQTIRVGVSPIEYLNVEISGTNVKAGSTGNTGLTFKNGGTFILKSMGVLKVSNEFGFTGTMTSAIKNRENLASLILENGSTVEYTRSGNQVISTDANVGQQSGHYSNLIISGSGVKSPRDRLEINEVLTIKSGELNIKETNDDVQPNILIAKNGVVNQGGRLVLENNAILLQSDNATNAGSIIQRRKATVASTQYNFWSSPVKTQNMYSIYNVPANKVMVYQSLTNNYTILSSATAEVGKGYSIKGPANSLGPIIADFNGEPYDGSSIFQLMAVGKHFNLVGNPYPSNIDLLALYKLNASPLDGGNSSDATSIDTTVYFWDNTNNTILNQQRNNYLGQNYAIFNLSTGIGNPATNGSVTKIPNGILKPGQGFMVKAKDSSSSLLKFSNGIRTGNYIQNQIVTPYFKNVNQSNNQFWLQLKTPTGIINYLAVAYRQGAQNIFDRFDSEVMNKTSNDLFYSLSTDAIALGIQGREGVFDNKDNVPLGLKFNAQGVHSISLAKTSGVFTDNQKIYLKDKKLQITHDLSESDYQFSTDSGIFNDRFEIVYEPEVVLNQKNELTKEASIVQIENSFLIKAKETIVRFEVYDISGKKIAEKFVENNQYKWNVENVLNGVYLVKLQLKQFNINLKIIKK